MKKGGDEYDDNPEPDDVTTDKPTMVVKSDVNKKPVKETDQTKPAPGAAAQKEEQSKEGQSKL